MDRVAVSCLSAALSDTFRGNRYAARVTHCGGRLSIGARYAVSLFTIQSFERTR